MKEKLEQMAAKSGTDRDNPISEEEYKRVFHKPCIRLGTVSFLCALALSYVPAWRDRYSGISAVDFQCAALRHCRGLVLPETEEKGNNGRQIKWKRVPTDSDDESVHSFF